MVVLRNLDMPGMVGVVGAMLGDAGINIANMHIGEIGQAGDGEEALMVVGDIGSRVAGGAGRAPGP